MLIETDILLAALNRRDPLCGAARKVLSLEHLLLSPYSLLEWNLLVRAGKIRVKDFNGFTSRLAALFRNRGIQVLMDKPPYHSLAQHIESKFRLSFFDSLHAAVAKTENLELVSFDKSYKTLNRIGVKHFDPRTLEE